MAIPKPFKASQFTATKWDTAAQKAKFGNHLVRFVLGGFKHTVFPKWFYTRLSNCFGHIAHFNRGGFYAEWFETADARRRWVERIVDWTIYGDPEYTYSDVERTVQQWMRSNRPKIDAAIDDKATDEQQAAAAETDRTAALQGQESQEFKVVQRSQNTGSFGHRRYGVVARDGSAWFIFIVPHNLSLNVGQVLTVPLQDGRPRWERFYVETPQRCDNVPADVVEQVWAAEAA